MAVRAEDHDSRYPGIAPHMARGGAWGEQVAERRYRRDGYRVLARNWRCSSGELDLIVGRGDMVVFSEVKIRSSTSFGWPAEAVDRRRQVRLRSAAAAWLRSTGTRPTEVRFDVVSVLPGHVERLEGAF